MAEVQKSRDPQGGLSSFGSLSFLEVAGSKDATIGTTPVFPIFSINVYITYIYIQLPGPSKGCQMVPKGCQFTIP